MGQGDTREKILHAAGLLFAERGFAETSLRTITGLAEVNLAAVNYHFGSKKELIQAVFANILGPFCEMLEQELDNLAAQQGDEPCSVEQVLACVSNALLRIPEETGVSVQRLMRLLSLAYTQSQEHLRQHLVASFGDIYTRCVGLLCASVNELSPIEFYWRLNYMLGALVFTLSSYDSLQAILNSDYDQENTAQESTDQESAMQDVLNSMIPSLAAILKAPQVKLAHAVMPITKDVNP